MPRGARCPALAVNRRASRDDGLLVAGLGLLEERPAERGLVDADGHLTLLLWDGEHEVVPLGSAHCWIWLMWFGLEEVRCVYVFVCVV